MHISFKPPTDTPMPGTNLKKSTTFLKKVTEKNLFMLHQTLPWYSALDPGCLYFSAKMLSLPEKVYLTPKQCREDVFFLLSVLSVLSRPAAC